MSEEINELQEHAEHAAHDHSLAPVTITMAILAVLVAAVSLLGHRAHTEEVLNQAKASDQWAYFQAKAIRHHNYEQFIDELSVLPAKSADDTEKLRAKYEKQIDRYKDEEKDIQTEATGLENEVKVEEHRADRFDLAEVILEAALVITSITILTKNKAFWLLGMILAAAGVVVALLGTMIH
jgi:glucan-binding YG repeat protein